MPHGVTATERYLSALARRSFLRLWSYSNLFRDQGIAQRGEGAELADLVVVFGNEIVLFSDKDCSFPNVPDPLTAWRRWFSRAVLESARQIHGAERWIRSHPERVFLDRRCRERVPLAFPTGGAARFHRIVVAHDSSGQRRRLIGGSGSLIVRPELKGQQHLGVDPSGRPWYAVGDLDETRGFVHVFDDSSLGLVLSELDTITDFLEYLRAKETFVRSGRLYWAAGEEDLLAYYLKHVVDDASHGFVVPETGRPVALEEGQWADLQARPQFRARKSSDLHSTQTWDRMIDYVAEHAMADALFDDAQVPIPLANTEQVLRALAAESRLRRRMLAGALADKIREAPDDGDPWFRVLQPSFPRDPLYVFLVMGRNHAIPPTPADESEYRRRRRDLLASYATLALHHYGDVPSVVGIATEAGNRSGRSYDMLLFERASAGSDLAEIAEDIRQHSGWLTKVRMSGGVTHEYPEDRGDGHLAPTTAYKDMGIGRNQPCPCGSGLKFKKCHGAPFTRPPRAS